MAMTVHNNMEDVLLFLHIPKAAGTTLTSVLMRQYPPESIFEVYGLVPDRRIEELKTCSPERRRVVQCVIGHFYFGLDELFDRRCRYITMLRDPVERVISSYYHVLRTPDNWLYRDVAKSGMTLEQYVKSEGPIAHEARNMQTRMMAGTAWDCILDEASLKTAKENLDKCAAVGVVERFDESLVLFKRRLGWTGLRYLKMRAGGRPRNSDISPSVLDAIRTHNELDIQLYQYAVQRLQMDIAGEGRGFVVDLMRLRTANRIYSGYSSLRRKLQPSRGRQACNL